MIGTYGARSERRAWYVAALLRPETCDDDSPNVIADVATTPAPRPDHEVTAAIQDRLADRDLLPREHIVDTGYLSADLLVTSRDDLPRHPSLRPAPNAVSWTGQEHLGPRLYRHRAEL